MSKLNLTHLEGVQIHGVGRQEGGGLKGTPVVIWGWLSAQATLNPPPQKNGPVPRRCKKADRQPFWFFQCMEKIMKSVFSL